MTNSVPEIIYEDDAVLVCVKAAGMPVQTASARTFDMVSALKNYRAVRKEEPYLGLIHRLDQPVEGVMVFAKTRAAAAFLSRQMSEQGMDKCYLAVAAGAVKPKRGHLKDYLLRDGKNNVSRTVSADTPGAKLAGLFYQVLEYTPDQDASLIKIDLETGRHHQIRVQMANAGFPLEGDRKYNPHWKGCENIALCSFKIGFIHPVTKKKMEFFIRPSNKYFQLFEQLPDLEKDVFKE